MDCANRDTVVNLNTIEIEQSTRKNRCVFKQIRADYRMTRTTTMRPDGGWQSGLDVVVMLIFNRFFDDRLNRLSKNRFFFDFLKFDFDLSITLKSKNRFLTPLLPYHVITARAKSARCRQTSLSIHIDDGEVIYLYTFHYSAAVQPYVALSSSFSVRKQVY